MADMKKYIYICENNHEIVSEEPVKKCLAVVRGSPCTGKLKSIGAGSRSKKKNNESGDG